MAAAMSRATSASVRPARSHSPIRACTRSMAAPAARSASISAPDLRTRSRDSTGPASVCSAAGIAARNRRTFSAHISSSRPTRRTPRSCAATTSTGSSVSGHAVTVNPSGTDARAAGSSNAGTTRLTGPWDGTIKHVSRSSGRASYPVRYRSAAPGVMSKASMPASPAAVRARFRRSWWSWVMGVFLPSTAPGRSCRRRRGHRGDDDGVDLLHGLAYRLGRPVALRDLFGPAFRRLLVVGGYHLGDTVDGHQQRDQCSRTVVRASAGNQGRPQALAHLVLVNRVGRRPPGAGEQAENLALVAPQVPGIGQSLEQSFTQVFPQRPEYALRLLPRPVSESLQPGVEHVVTGRRLVADHDPPSSDRLAAFGYADLAEHRQLDQNGAGQRIADLGAVERRSPGFVVIEQQQQILGYQHDPDATRARTWSRMCSAIVSAALKSCPCHVTGCVQVGNHLGVVPGPWPSVSSANSSSPLAPW